jgi:hypothetical protein
MMSAVLSNAIPVETLAEHAASPFRSACRAARRRRAGAGGRWRVSVLRRPARLVHDRRPERRAKRALLLLLVVRHVVELSARQMHVVRRDQGDCLSGDRKRAGNGQSRNLESCHGYVKILHQHKEPMLDPVADDVATLALDLLLRDLGYRRGAVDPFLLGLLKRRQ